MKREREIQFNKKGQKHGFCVYVGVFIIHEGYYINGERKGVFKFWWLNEYTDKQYFI